MTQEVINIGALPDDGTGDTIRGSGIKVNNNFTELFARGSVLSDIDVIQNNISTTASNADIVIKPSGSGSVVFPAITFDNNNIKATRTNDDLKFTASGSGLVVIGGLGFTGTSIVATDSTTVNLNENIVVDGTINTGATTFESAVTVNSSLDVAGATTLSTLTATGASSFVGTTAIDNLSFNDNIIATASNADLILTPGGTGAVVLPGVTINDNHVTGTRSNEDLVITASGSADILLGPIRINGTTLDSSDSASINMNDGVIVDGTINANTPTFDGAVIANSTLGVTSGTTLSALTVSGASSFVGTTTIDNLNFNDNIISTSSNADLNLTPGGTGVVNVSNLTIDSSVNLTDNIIKVTRTNDDFMLTASGSGSVQISKVSMSAGTVDNTVIGGTTPAAGTFSSIAFTSNTITADGVTITDNTIKANRSNDNLAFDASGSGVVKINGFSLPGADGSTGQVFKTDGSKTLSFLSSPVLLGTSDIQDASTTISFRTLTEIDHVTAVGTHARIESGTVAQDSWATSKYDSAWYLAVNRDDASDEFEVTKHSVVHNNSDAFITTSIDAKTGTNNHVLTTADVDSGSVRLLGTGSSPENSVSFYRIGLGDDDSTGYSGEDEAAVVINTDVDSASEIIDSWAHGSFRGAKYYISVNNGSKTELMNCEASVVHNGTTAFISTYNIVNTGSNDLITLSAAINGSNVEVKAAGLEPNLRVHAYRIRLADDEADRSSTNVNVIGEVTVSSASTTLDTFDTGSHQAAHYVIVANNGTEGHSSICEAAVVSDGTNAFVSQYGLVSSKGTDQILLTAAHDGSSTVTLSATSTSGGSTTVNAYRVNLTRGEGTSSAVATLDSVSASTFRSAKYNVQVVDATGSKFELFEANVVHDGSTAYISTFAHAGSHTDLITVSADIDSGNLRLRGTINNTNDHVVKVVRRVIEV